MWPGNETMTTLLLLREQWHNYSDVLSIETLVAWIHPTWNLVPQTTGCFQDQPPNATHIIASRYYYFEGEDILIFCEFNGDIDLNHYDVEWNKDDQDDITNQVNPPIAKKYNSYRQNNCPVESECCSYHDILTVHDASRNDSGVYTCLAWPVVGGTPRGSNLSVHVCKYFSVLVNIPYSGKYSWGPNFILFVLSLSEWKFNTWNVRYDGRVFLCRMDRTKIKHTNQLEIAQNDIWTTWKFPAVR